MLRRHINTALVASFLAAAGAYTTPTAHAWQDPIVPAAATTVELPLDGRPVDLEAYAPEGEDPLRFWLVGTVSNRIDGIERDAFAVRRVQGFEPSSANVVLPPGARVVRRDAHRHAYLIEVPRGPRLRLALPVASWASGALVTRSEMVSALSGRMDVEIVTPAPAAVAVATPAVVPSAAPPRSKAPWGVGFVLLFAAGVGVTTWRRRRRSDRVAMYMNRGRRATAHAQAECRRLGPAFSDVAARAEDARDVLEQTRRHIVAIDAALVRTAALEAAGAAEARVALERERSDELDRMRGTVERLEEIAARLAAQVAGQARDGDLERRLASLDEDLDIALSADDEARGVSAASVVGLTG